jgi:hypothetical protein
VVLGIHLKTILKAYLQISEIDYFFLTMDENTTDGQEVTPEETPEVVAPETQEETPENEDENEESAE